MVCESRIHHQQLKIRRMIDSVATPAQTTSLAPHPGSKRMPRWNVGHLPEAPQFRWTGLWQFLGPGLLMGGAAIGGGEWLQGPLVAGGYGGGPFWLGAAHR